MAKGGGESSIAPFAGDTFALRLRIDLVQTVEIISSIFYVEINNLYLYRGASVRTGVIMA